MQSQYRVDLLSLQQSHQVERNNRVTSIAISTFVHYFPHDNAITSTDVPTAVSPIRNSNIILVGVISAAVIVMIVTLASIVIGFSIRHWRRKW